MTPIRNSAARRVLPFASFRASWPDGFGHGMQTLTKQLGKQVLLSRDFADLVKGDFDLEPSANIRCAGLATRSSCLPITAEWRAAERQFGFAASAAAGAGAAGRHAGAVKRSITSARRRGSCDPSPRRAGGRHRRAADQAFGSGNTSGSSTGLGRRTAGRSRAGRLGAEVRLATPFRSYSRVGTEAVPVSVRRVAGPSRRMSSAVAMPSLNFTATVSVS